MIGSVTYWPADDSNGDRDLFAIHIPCKTEYFESVEAFTQQVMGLDGGEAFIDVGVIGFLEDWKPKAPDLPNPTFWVTYVEMRLGSSTIDEADEVP